MGNLSLKTEGVKGGAIKHQESIGKVTAFIGHSEDFISIDAYQGQGATYKKREVPVIEVYQNGKLLFSGSKYELFEILKGK